MAKRHAAKRISTTEIQDEVSGVSVSQRPPAYVRPDGPFDLVLGFRRLRTGSFSGLWELTRFKIDPKDVKELTILIDASLKRFVIGQAAKALTRTL